MLVKDWKKPERATEVGFFRLDLVALRKQIDLAPFDDEPDWKEKRRLIYFPLPDGTLYPILINRQVSAVKGYGGYCSIRGVDPKDPTVEAMGFISDTGIDFRIRFKNKVCYWGPAVKSPANIFVSCYIKTK